MPLSQRPSPPLRGWVSRARAAAARPFAAGAAMRVRVRINGASSGSHFILQDGTSRQAFITFAAQRLGIVPDSFDLSAVKLYIEGGWDEAGEGGTGKGDAGGGSGGAGAGGACGADAGGWVKIHGEQMSLL